MKGLLKKVGFFPEHLDVPGHDGEFGFGGKCFPKDLSAMVEYAKQNNIDPKIMQAAKDKNRELRNDT